MRECLYVSSHLLLKLTGNHIEMIVKCSFLPPLLVELLPLVSEWAGSEIFERTTTSVGEVIPEIIRMIPHLPQRMPYPRSAPSFHLFFFFLYAGQ